MSYDGQGPLAGPERFTETAVLFAVMNGDQDRAVELLEDMTPAELSEFYGQVSRTLDLTVSQLRTRNGDWVVF